MSRASKQSRQMTSWRKRRAARQERLDAKQEPRRLLVYDECAGTVARRCEMVEEAGGEFLMVYVGPHQAIVFTRVKACEPDCPIDHEEDAEAILRQSLVAVATKRARAFASCGYPVLPIPTHVRPALVTAADLAALLPHGKHPE